MVKTIIRDKFFLAMKSEPAIKGNMEDMKTGGDLMDTLTALRRECVGLAANMIGVKKRIIVVATDLGPLVMFNPVITAKSGEYETEEGCLSLTGQRKCKRYKNITVEYFDIRWKKHVEDYEGFTAEIIQHECDHLEGIII